MGFPSLMVRFIVHGQILMALSAVCYVQVAGLIVDGRRISFAWSAAAFLGTLGIYLLDSLRSADREDPISQPERARLFSRHPGRSLCYGLASLILGFLCLLAASPSPWVWFMLLVLAFLATCYLLPLVPLGRRHA